MTNKTSMDISAIDKNMLTSDAAAEIPMVRYEIPDEHFDLYGLNYSREDGFYRLPYADAARVSEKVCALRRNTTGGRLRFRTDAAVMQLTMKCEKLHLLTHMAMSGSSGFSLMEVTADGYRHAAVFRPQATDAGGFTCQKELKGGKMREYILYFPLYNDVDFLELAFNAEAKVEKGSRYAYEKPMVFYGSSITQGACASSPNNPYMAYLSEWNDIDYRNYGFSGSAKGERAIAEYLAKIPAEIFVFDYDHNGSAELLKENHEAFFKLYRAANPTVPVVFATSINYWKNTEAFGRRREIILQTYHNALASGDKNVWLVDGKTIYDPQQAHHFTTDNLHPNDLGFYRMANAFQPIIAEILGKTK